MNKYPREYFECGGGSHYLGYEDGPVHRARAEAIIREFNPKTVLDIGCAKGFTVKHLRDLGVQAYGLDVSEYAVSQANEYVTQCDITHGLPFDDQEFDLIVSWDVLEHIPGESIPFVVSELKRVGKKNFHRIATYSDEDDVDKTHVSIHPIEWWWEFFPEAVLQGSFDPDL